MSIRYSGDTEVRLGYDEHHRVYRGSVADGQLRWHGEVSPSSKIDPRDPRAYDVAAQHLLRDAEAWARSQRRRFMLDWPRGKELPSVRRVFQAACPIK